MKKIAGAILITILFVPVLGAWDVTGNPDQVVSIGFNVMNASIDGQRSETDLPGNLTSQRTQLGFEERDLYSIGGDIRIPVQRSLTVNLSYDSISENGKFTRQGGVFQEKTNLDGYKLGFGMRLYFNK